MLLTVLMVWLFMAGDVPATPPPAFVESGPAERTLEASPQREGDPAAGYDALVNGGYMTCGLPWSMYRRAFGSSSSPLKGRTGTNAKLPLELSASTNAEGVEVVAPNCLGCHASRLNGKLVIGLGTLDIDMTQDLTTMAWAARFFTRTDAEQQAWREWYRVLSATQRYTVLDTVGVHSADNLAIALAAHRDPKSLAWTDEERFAPPRFVVPTDIPAWWLLKKKGAMYQTGIGRGDQARLMMSSALYCTSDVEEARRIDRAFVDVRAYLMTLKAPKYPGRVDRRLAREGRDVFEGHCADCHGTYARDGVPGEDTYPNKVIALSEIGTDPMLSRGSQADANGLVDWYNRSFFGERSKLVPTDGYIAPPLDGVWATAPYFHNGSVPSLEGVVDTTQRPRFWKRTGTGFEALSHGKDHAGTSRERTRIYDTTRPGYSNAGHDYGDELSPEERLALLEYLKTL